MAGKLASTGGGGKRNRMEPNSSPNVIPFIDIMLVMLIIFMVTAPLPTVDIRIDLPPPNAVSRPPPEGQKPTMVVVNAQGLFDFTVSVDGVPTTMAQLSDVVLQHAIQNNSAIPISDIYSQAGVFVKADQSTTYGNVVSVMTRLQEDGFVKVGILAEQAQEG